MHPLIEDVENLKTPEVEAKIQDLSRKYYQTTNPQVQQQIILMLDGYREELDNRRRQEWKNEQDNRDSELDNLINVR
jgi:nitroreductase